MEAFCRFLLVVLLLYIFYKDSRTLFLPIWVFFPLVLLWGILHYLHLGLIALCIHTLTNLLGLASAFVMVKIYAIWKSWELFDYAMGFGDVLFLAAFAWAYPPQIYFGLWCLMSFASFLIALALRQKKVPYAGYLALGNAVFLVFDWVAPLPIYSTFTLF